MSSSERLARCNFIHHQLMRCHGFDFDLTFDTAAAM